MDKPFNLNDIILDDLNFEQIDPNAGRNNSNGGRIPNQRPNPPLPENYFNQMVIQKLFNQNRQLIENNRQLTENNRQLTEHNRQLTEMVVNLYDYGLAMKDLENQLRQARTMQQRNAIPTVTRPAILHAPAPAAPPASPPAKLPNV